MKRIEKLSSFHDDHWIVIRDMGDKLNEVIEAINTLTERLAEHIDHEARHVSEPTQVEPDKSQAFLDKAAKMQGTYTSTGSSESDTEQLQTFVDTNKDGHYYVKTIHSDGRMLESKEAYRIAEKIRNLLKGQS